MSKEVGWEGGSNLREGGGRKRNKRRDVWREGGGRREGGLTKGTNEEGTGRGMDDGREEASGGGIERGREGAREHGRETSREVSILMMPLASTV